MSEFTDRELDDICESHPGLKIYSLVEKYLATDLRALRIAVREYRGIITHKNPDLNTHRRYMKLAEIIDELIKDDDD